MEWVAVVQIDSFSSSMAGRLILARYKLILHIRLVLENLAQSPIKTTKIQANCVSRLKFGKSKYYVGALLLVGLPASVAHLDAPSDWRPGGRGFNPR